MTDFPGSSFIAPPTISVQSPWACGANTLGLPTNALGGAAWPTNNLGIFVPFNLPCPFVVRAAFCHNSTTASGNLDIGVFSQDGALLVSKGSTAMSGTSTLQILTLTETLLQPGAYYMAMSSSTTVAIFNRWAYSATSGQRHLGILQASSQLPLATNPTLATPSNDYVPHFGIASVTTF